MLAEETKFLLIAQIAAVAYEVAVLVVLARNTESSVLYNRGVVQSQASRTRGELTSKINRTRNRVMSDVTKSFRDGFNETELPSLLEQEPDKKG